MEELEVKQEAYPAILDGYAKQGRMFLLNAAQNLIQYGRVLTEAKAVCRHGEFAKWVEENFGMKERSAQGYMAVWRRFGENESLNGMKFSNLQKMLALPEGAEEQFAKENDIENMTARQVAAAVAKAKEEAQRKLNSAMADAAVQLRESEAARKLAERRAEIAEQNAGENPEQAERIRVLEAKFAAAADDAMQANQELENLREELADAEDLLKESQQEYDRVQAELLNAQSAAARGDAERTIGEQLTGEDFAGAVRLFLGSVAQMPYMSGTFAQISDGSEYRQWDELLQAVEDWAKRARRALDGKAGIIDG